MLQLYLNSNDISIKSYIAYFNNIYLIKNDNIDKVKKQGNFLKFDDHIIIISP